MLDEHKNLTTRIRAATTACRTARRIHGLRRFSFSPQHPALNRIKSRRVSDAARRTRLPACSKKSPKTMGPPTPMDRRFDCSVDTLDVDITSVDRCHPAGHVGGHRRVGDADGGSHHVSLGKPHQWCGFQAMPSALTAYLAVAAPAIATCASCSDVAPDTPMAPTILPSAITGTPPSSASTLCAESRRKPAPPPATTS